ncbi:MAG: TraR/DksA family transcriptional regulator [Candidatus Hydrogenedentota bacterium]|jgi:DnaK suppressor protein
MDKIELVRARNRMEALRIDLLAEKEAAAEAIAPVELDQARVGRLSRMDSMQQQAMALEQDRRRDVQLKRIEGAFQRIENRTYGVCVKCSSPIEEKRIEFDCTVFFCQRCAAQSEQR